MDNLRLDLCQCATDGPQCQKILQWIEAANQFRENDQVESTLAGLTFQRTLRSCPGTGDQAHLVVEQVVLVINIEECVFLSAADDQPSDDVSCAHRNGR